MRKLMSRFWRTLLKNLKLASPNIQKDMVNAIVVETLNAIINDIRDLCFSILVDESRDVLTKKQMAIALRYVNEKGNMVEFFFLRIKHVIGTTASSLKGKIDGFRVVKWVNPNGFELAR